MRKKSGIRCLNSALVLQPGVCCSFSAFQLLSFCLGNFSSCFSDFYFLFSSFLLFRLSPCPGRQAGRAALLWSTHLSSGLCFQHFSLSAFQFLLE